MEQETGIVLYNIQIDGHLHGVYSSDVCKGKVYTEMAHRLPKKDDVNKGLCYQSYYFYEGGKGTSCTLYLKDEQTHYKAIWEGKESFDGIGYKLNDNQIAITYNRRKK